MNCESDDCFRHDFLVFMRFIIKDDQKIRQFEHHSEVVNTLTVYLSDIVVTPQVADVNTLERGELDEIDLDFLHDPGLPKDNSNWPEGENYDDNDEELPALESYQIEEVFIVGYGHEVNFKFQQLNRTVIVSDMKEEAFPEIPQEQLAQSHSMYEQLRRTSQKWFTRSHKRIFDGRSSYQHNDSSKISQTHKVIVDHDENNCETSTDKMRMMEIMREQIEISCKQYTVKMKSCIQDQARKIKILGDLLIKNQIQLSNKARVINEITCSIMKFKQTKGYSTGNQYSIAEKKIATLETRIKEIEIILNSNRTGEKISAMEERFKKALGELSEGYFSRLQEIRFDLEDRLDRAQKLNHLNLSTTKGVRTSSIINRESGHLQQKLNKVHEQIEELKIQISSLQRKKYSYDNYQLNQTQDKLKSMQKVVSRIEADRKQEDHVSTRTGWKGSQTTQLTYTEVNNLTKSSSKTRFINRYKSLISNRKMREVSYSSDNSNDSQVEATLVEDEENNVERFERVFGMSQIARPVLIEVDQTGYAKSVDTGMYLVDGTGNGFEFTLSQLQYLRTRGVIEIM